MVAGALDSFPVTDPLFLAVLGQSTDGARQAFNAGGPAFSISGVPLAQDSAIIEAGIDVKLAGNATLGIAYSGQLAGDIEDHGITGRLDWRF